MNSFHFCFAAGNDMDIGDGWNKKAKADFLRVLMTFGLPIKGFCFFFFFFFFFFAVCSFCVCAAFGN